MSAWRSHRVNCRLEIGSLRWTVNQFTMSHLRRSQHRLWSCWILCCVFCWIWSVSKCVFDLCNTLQSSFKLFLSHLLTQMTDVCVSVCLSVHTIAPKRLKLQPPNLPQGQSIVSPGGPYNIRSEVKVTESQSAETYFKQSSVHELAVCWVASLYMVSQKNCHLFVF